MSSKNIQLTKSDTSGNLNYTETLKMMHYFSPDGELLDQQHKQNNQLISQSLLGTHSSASDKN